MKEDQFKALMKESVVKTSEDFTEKLFMEIEVRRSRKLTKALFIPAMLICLILLLLIPQLHFNISWTNVQLPLYSRVTRILGSIIILLFINQLLSLQSRSRRIKYRHA